MVCGQRCWFAAARKKPAPVRALRRGIPLRRAWLLDRHGRAYYTTARAPPPCTTHFHIPPHTTTPDIRVTRLSAHLVAFISIR